MAPIRILLIDDDPDDAALAAKLLSGDAGWEVRTVASSSAFAAALSQARFDASVVESKLRWSSALEVIAALRARAPTRPVVLFTAEAAPQFLSTAIGEGLDGWVVKSSRGFVSLPGAVRAALDRAARPLNPTDASIHLLVDRAAVALFQCTTAGQYVDGNPAFVSLLGLAPAETMDVNVIERLLPENQRAGLLSRLREERVVQLPDLTVRGRRGAGVLCALTATLTTEGGETLLTGLLDPKATPAAPAPFQAAPTLTVERALGTAHDLKEPLRTIEHYADALRTRYHGRLDQDADEFLAYLQDAARRMKSQIGQLFQEAPEKPAAVAPRAPVALNLPRVAPPAAPPSEPASAQAAFDRAIANLRASIDATDAQITHGPLPPLPIGEEELAQLFQNLIGNAIKFSGPERPKVHVSAVQTGGEWLVSVEDNGIGISPEDAPRLFSMFSRGRGATDRPGSGIGLALCRSIVERAGGRIWAAHNTGRGTTFFFTLPPAASAHPTLRVAGAADAPRR